MCQKSLGKHRTQPSWRCWIGIAISWVLHQKNLEQNSRGIQAVAIWVVTVDKERQYVYPERLREREVPDWPTKMVCRRTRSQAQTTNSIGSKENADSMMHPRHSLIIELHNLVLQRSSRILDHPSIDCSTSEKWENKVLYLFNNRLSSPNHFTNVMIWKLRQKTVRLSSCLTGG